MKIYLKISCVTILMVCFVSVTFADVGVHKVPKKENTCMFELVNLDFAVSYEGSTPLAFGILAEPILIHKNEFSYTCKKNENYVNKKIDRKWVWWYSIVSNT